MANTCIITNNKQSSPEEIILLIKNELINKFSFTVKEEYDPNHESFCFEINELNFVFFLNKKDFEFYDCPDTALSRHNQGDYVVQAFENGQYYAGISSGFCYIYEYIKNFLANYQSSLIDSDGIGPYKAFNHKNKFNSFKEWINYCDDQVKKESLSLKAYKKLSVPSKDKIIATELNIFPELK